MAYATLADMVERYGEAEMIRSSATGDTLPIAPDEARVLVALGDATGVIESYLRPRYLLPLAPPPREILHVCCVLARYWLNTGHEKTPTDQMIADRKEAITWLISLRDGKAEIEAPGVGTDGAGGARVTDRPREFTGRGLP